MAPKAGRWGILVGAMLWLSVVAGAYAEMRVGLLGLADSESQGPALQKDVASELRKRGASAAVLEDADAQWPSEGVSPRSVRRFSFARNLDALVVGRTVESEGADGDVFEIDVYSGQSGVRLGGQQLPEGGPADSSSTSGWPTWVAETLGLPSPGDSPRKTSGGRPRASTGPSGRGLQDWVEIEGSAEPLPLKIDAESLEVFGLGDRGRRIRFTEDVEVTQGAFLLLADELEAFYPPGHSQPARLLATGNVRIEQGSRRARCQSAEYIRSQDQVVCSGEAVLIQECDTVRGERIEIQLRRDRARVIGAASVVIAPENEQTSRPCAKLDS